MEKEFIPYEEALALKELGFDKECLMEYHNQKITGYSCGDPSNNSELEDLYGGEVIGAPLYQQAFRWFRKKYNTHSAIVPRRPHSDYKGPIRYQIEILRKDEEGYVNPPHLPYRFKLFKTYEEAELECLKKLIEIVKEK
mgnify:CR=1 FL=1